MYSNMKHYCPTCNIGFNSLTHYQRHCETQKHKKLSEYKNNNTDLQYVTLINLINEHFPFSTASNSVSISPDGNTLVFGSIRALNEFGVMTGSVRIYEWNDSSWVSKGNTIYSGGNNALTGQSVNISPDGNTVAFGSKWYKNKNGDVVGSASMYEWTGSMWIHKITVYGDSDNQPAGNGVSLSSEGNVLASSGQYGNIKRALL